MINHSDIVDELHDAQPPARTVDGALAFLLRLIAALQARFPGERVGLLVKTAGENIAEYAGTSVSAGRICYPDLDLLVKVLSDVPTTNGPSWQTEEGIPNEGHHGGYLAVSGEPLPAGGDTPWIDVPRPPSTGPLDAEWMRTTMTRLDLIAGLGNELVRQQTATNTTIDDMGKRVADAEGRLKRLEDRPAPEPPTEPATPPAITIPSSVWDRLPAWLRR